MEQAKFNVVIDDIADYTEKGKFKSAIVEFSLERLVNQFVYWEELVGQVEFNYEDDDSSEYYKDIKRILREPKSMRKSGEYHLIVKNDDYGDLIITIPNDKTTKQVKELLKEIGREI